MNSSDIYRFNLIIKISGNFSRDIQELLAPLKSEEKLDVIDTFILITKKCEDWIIEDKYHTEINDIYNNLRIKYRSKLKITDEKSIM